MKKDRRFVCVCVCVCVYTHTRGVCQEEGHSLVAAAAELPGLGEGGERAQVVGLVEAHQLALHLLGGADGAGAPLEGAGAALRLAQQLGAAAPRRTVTRQQDGGLALRRH